MGNIRKVWTFTGSEGQIASNSLSVKGGDLVAVSGGYVVKATHATGIDGVAVGTREFSATNQTTEKEVLQYVKNNEGLRVELETDGVLNQTMVGG